MAAVQFYGKDTVLKAYNGYNVSVWGIFNGTELMQTGEGDTELSEYLDLISPAASEGAYKLRVYRSISDSDKVTSKSEPSGSFNFKLTEARKPAMGGTESTASMVYNKIQGVIDREVSEAIDRKLNGADEEEEESIGSVILGYLKEPDKLIPVLQVLKGLFSPSTAVIQGPVRMAGTGAPAQATQKPAPAGPTDEELTQRLSVCLETLEEADPDILEHLEKLAALSKSDPGMFQMVIKKFALL
jgi:hypothetical protein